METFPLRFVISIITRGIMTFFISSYSYGIFPFINIYRVKGNKTKEAFRRILTEKTAATTLSTLRNTIRNDDDGDVVL